MAKKTPIKSEKENSHGTLFVVATPIGNLEDITLRAIRILKETDIIAAEDTRHTRKLLSHLGISTPTMSYFKEKEQERTSVIIDKLKQGLDVALVSDAGTPGISDPGSILVQRAAAEEIRIEPIPGPSALTAALSVAGLRDGAFVFLGFAPSRKKQRRDLLRSLSSEKRSLVFFEAPHRFHSFLQDCLDVFGDREIFWCRELTKIHEEQKQGRISSLLPSLADKKPKGESVVVIAGADDDAEISEEEIVRLLQKLEKTGEYSLKDAVRAVTDAHGLSRSVVYRKALKVWK